MLIHWKEILLVGSYSITKTGGEGEVEVEVIGCGGIRREED